MRNPLKACKKPLNSLQKFGSDFVRREEGQMAPMMMTALLIAYTTFMGAAIDMGNLMWHKSHATTAANAACLAGAADLVWVADQATPTALANYESSSTGFQMAVNTSGSIAAPGSSISGDCSSAKTSVAMCAYAVANGYNPSIGGNDISWTVSNMLPVQQTINSNGAGSVGSFTTQQNAAQVTTPNGVLPFLRVAVTEEVPTYLLSIMPSFHSPVTVTGVCNCGIANSGAQGSTGGTSGAAEQTLTGQCAISSSGDPQQNGFAAFSSEWQIASESPEQLRTTGNNNPTDWVYVNCRALSDSSENIIVNVLQSIPNITVDGVTVSIDTATQGSASTSALIENVELIGTQAGLLPPPAQCCNLQNLPIALPGEQQVFPEIPIAPANGSFPFYTIGTPTDLWGLSSSNMLNAIQDDGIFGFAVAYQGNGSRIFLGGGDGGIGNQPFMTVYYHTSRYYATIF